MDDRTALHLKRVRDGLNEISEIRQRRDNAFSPTLRAWKQRVTQSLGEIFGKDHDYSSRFSGLSFWKMRISPGKHSWTPMDQEKFENDLFLAEQLLSDVLEELDVIPPTAEAPSEKTTDRPQPQIVINVTNVLSQTTEVQINQVLESLKDLDLSEDERAQAEQLAKDLAEEARAQQRWPVLAKALDGLKSLGKSVYERVAIPLILEMLKKQIGL